MWLRRLLRLVALSAGFAGIGAGAYASRAHWLPLLEKNASPPSAESGEESSAPAGKVIVNEQAQLNLGLTAKVLSATTYWKTIQVPGMVVDRPGLSDRGVVAPAAGVVSRVHHFPGDSVRSGDPLFTLKLMSETLHQTQSDLFKTTQDIKLAQAERSRLAALTDTVAGVEIIKVDQQITRLQIAHKATRLELLNRGFTPRLVDGVAEGTFVNEITVPTPLAAGELAVSSPAGTPALQGILEVQELKVDPGQQVQAGQTLCFIANHQKLAVEGRAFRDETPLLEKSVRERWPVDVDFQEDAAAEWGDVKQAFRIRTLSNTIDQVNRTFAFLMPLENESRAIDDEGRTQTLWRFRPGQKCRLLVRVERIDNVFVLPADAVAREGADAFIFSQNVNTFERRPVRVLLQSRDQVVLANDGSVPPGTFVVQSGATQLNRMVKAGGSSAVPKGYHIHADGSLHKNEDEGK
ncbi:hypothetical protein J0H58_12015 [bacterium]|nr:hypothetical protein [bacterium]